MDSDSKIFVAGHKGLVGSAIVRNLESNGHTNIITRTRDELDLTNSDAVKKFFMEEHGNLKGAPSMQFTDDELYDIFEPMVQEEKMTKKMVMRI